MSKEGSSPTDGPGCPLVAARGGQGGRGTPALRTPTRQAPASRKPGFRATRSISSCDSSSWSMPRSVSQCGQIIAPSPHLEREAEGRGLSLHDDRACPRVVDGPMRGSSRSPMCGPDRTRRRRCRRAQFLAHLERAQLPARTRRIRARSRGAVSVLPRSVSGVRLGSRRAPPARRVEQDRPARRAARVLGDRRSNRSSRPGRARPVRDRRSRASALRALSNEEPRGGAGSARSRNSRVSTASARGPS